MLFAHLAGVSHQVAGIIFFRIVNTRSRLAILERLMRLKHGDRYNAFFNATMKRVSALDTTRNSIIHWATMINVETPEVSFSLVPPNFWDHDENTPEVTHADLIEFEIDCDYHARGLNAFTMHLSGYELPEPSRGIFQQPLPYPPPEDHPLFRKPLAPSNPPQSSQA